MIGRSEADQASMPRVVALTMARDEADLLPRWVDYYGRQVGVENLIVLDDNSADGSTDDLPCMRLRLPPGPWQPSWAQARLDLVNGLSRGLLACYEVVVFVDIDEFLVPDPAHYDGLADYLGKNRDRDVIAPLAVNVLHKPSLEPTLDPTQPLLAQRHFVKFAPGMCKPLVKRKPADWLASFHGIAAPFEIDPRLWMMHLKYCDVSLLMKVSAGRHARHREGRGHPRSAWALGSNELASQLSSWVQTPDEQRVQEFDPSELDLSTVVRRKGGRRFRSHGPQLSAMERNPLRRLPERFRTAF